MIDLAYLYAAAAALVLLALRRGGLWARWWAPLALAGASWALLTIYPALFDFRIGDPCEPAPGHAVSARSPTYFGWRAQLEADGKVSVPWWYPETDGDEAEWSGGVSYRCHPPLGLFTQEAAQLRLQPGFPFRVGSVAGAEVTTREQAARVLAGLPPGAVKATIYSARGREVVPLLVEGPGAALPPATLLHLGPDGVLFLEPSTGAASLLYRINDRPARSVATILGMSQSAFNWVKISWGTDALSRPPGSDEFMGLGFVLGPRLFRVSPLLSLESTAALGTRMLGLHGHGVLGITSYLPDQWYLLPLRSPFQIDYIYFRLASLLLAVALALALVRPALRRARPALAGGKAEIALVFALTMLALLNDTWILARF